MDTLATRIERISDLNRVALIQELIRIDAVAQVRAHRQSRASRGTLARYRSEAARNDSDRLGQIIYFLRFRTSAINTSEEDMALCEMLAQKLQVKNDWIGEVSN